jgi:putative membrane protein
LKAYVDTLRNKLLAIKLDSLSLWERVRACPGLDPGVRANTHDERSSGHPHLEALPRAGERETAQSHPKQALIACGLLMLGAVWLGPLPQLARQAFFAHMLMHMGVVAVAAPVLALGFAGGRLDPARKVPWLFAPIQASILELVVVWAWHAPALHHLARHHTAVLIIEQAMFFGAGIFVWLSAFGGDASSRRYRSAAGVVALLLTAMHMTLLGALLALSPRPLYAHVAGFAALTATDDQHLGGAIMLLIGGVSYLFGGLWLTVRLLRDPLLRPAERS